MTDEHPGRAYFEPTRLGPVDLRNGITRTAAFEGMCQGGDVTPQLISHHRDMAAGGVSLTTVAYCAVSPEGRTYDHQLLMRPEVVPGLRTLTDAIHAEGAAAGIQLGHSGYFADKKVVGKPLGASRVYCLYGLSYPRVMTEQDIERVTQDFVRAAELAREAGFDVLELHFGHGYLLSQFLSPYTNRRTDRYGGSLENRLRFPLAVLERVRDAVPADVAVVPKVNLEDGFARGLQIDEAVEATRRYEAAGATALVLSGGFVSKKTAFYMLRGNLPVKEMAKVQPGVTRRMGLRLFGRVFVQEYPFEELFFLERAREVRQAVSLPLVLVGGVCSMQGLDQAREEGFELVALGRALIRDPTFPRRLERGEITVSDCDHCNRCVAEMDGGGVRCVCPPEQ